MSEASCSGTGLRMRGAAGLGKDRARGRAAIQGSGGNPADGLMVRSGQRDVSPLRSLTPRAGCICGPQNPGRAPRTS